MRIVFSEVTTAPLDPAAATARVADDRAGACLTFTGVVRNHDQGEGVDSIEYSAHPQAGEVLAAVAAEFAAREGVHALGVAHRIGHLHVGDVALVAVVAASHRSQAFTTLSDMVDHIKKVLPVWKKQHFSAGDARWSEI